MSRTGTSKRLWDSRCGCGHSAADIARREAELVAAQFETVAAAAGGCDALVATGVMLAGVRL
jgi:hypothetical protein